MLNGLINKSWYKYDKIKKFLLLVIAKCIKIIKKFHYQFCEVTAIKTSSKVDYDTPISVTISFKLLINFSCWDKFNFSFY